MEIADKGKHFCDQRDDVFGFIISCEKQIKTGATSHRAKVYSFISKSRMIAKESSTEMLDRVEFSGIHDRLLIWGSHAKIKRCDRICTDVVLAGYINARRSLIWSMVKLAIFSMENLSFCFFNIFDVGIRREGTYCGFLF